MRWAAASSGPLRDAPRRGGRGAGGRARRGEPGPARRWRPTPGRPRARAAALGARARPRARPLSEQALALAPDLGRPRHARRRACSPATTSSGRRARRKAEPRSRPRGRAHAAAGRPRTAREGPAAQANALLEAGARGFGRCCRAPRAPDGFGQPATTTGRDPPSRAGAARRPARRGRAADRGAARSASGIARARRGQRVDVAAAGAGPGPGRPRRLAAFAAEAVAHWAGAPCTPTPLPPASAPGPATSTPPAADLDAVRALDGWRADRSYLWSVFVARSPRRGGGRRPRAVRPAAGRARELTGTCGVNGALVAFTGSNAHTAGRLAAALGDPVRARALLAQACEVYGGWARRRSSRRAQT